MSVDMEILSKSEGGGERERERALSKKKKWGRWKEKLKFIQGISLNFKVIFIDHLECHHAS